MRIIHAEKSLRSVNIEVRKTNDSFYEFDQIMGAIYEKLDELSDVDLSRLAYDVAGVRQSSIFRSMIQSYGTYLKLAEEAENSQGKALEVQEKYAKSIKGHLGELKSTGESIWNNVLNSGELKAGVDTLATVLKLLDGITGTLKGLGTIGLGLGAYFGATNSGRDKMLSLILIEYACSNIVSYSKNKFLILPFVKYTIESRVELTTVYIVICIADMVSLYIMDTPFSN